MNSGGIGPQTDDGRGRLGIDSQRMLDGLNHRVKYTFYSRLETAKRMQRRALTWNTFLVVSSIITSMVSIVLLEDSNAFGHKGQVMLVIVGIGTLSASLLVTSSNYAAKSEMYFRGYRDLQTLWNEIDHAKEEMKPEVKELEDRYQQILNELPNHSDADYQKAKMEILQKEKLAQQEVVDNNKDQHRGAYKLDFSARLHVLISGGFSYLPIGLSVLFLGLLIPMIAWLLR